MTSSSRLRKPRFLALAVALLVALGVALTACGGSPTPPGPTGVITVTGGLQLPAGHGIDLATLTISTPLGVFPVTATGEFEADVFDGAHTEVGVETAGGDLLLLGVTDDDSLDLSLASTAEALLYYLVGGMWLPGEQQDTVRELLRDLPEAETLETELTRQLQAGGNGLAAPDQALVDALDDVHAALFGDARITRLWAAALATPAAEAPGSLPAGTLHPAAGDNVIIEPPSTVIAGVEVIHNPEGSGVVAQNHFRRPAAILAYETGWEDAEGVLTENDTPVPVATVDVPATGQLEFFEALLDVVTADSPWSPVVSPKVSLPDHPGASRTHFTLVAVGPSGTDATWPIMDEERFDIFHGHWENIENEKTLELFLDQLLLPLVEVYGIGSLAKMDAAKLADLRSRMRLIHDEHLLGLGVLLKNRQKGLVDALKYAIKEMVENDNLRLDMMEMVRDALSESDKNKLEFEAAEKRLASRANASAIGAAVETLLVSGDVAKILHDLASAPAAVHWTVKTSPALFVLMPENAYVTKLNPSVRLRVLPKGEAAGTYLYRWTTSGTHGSLSDLLNDGDSLTTVDPEVWYFHDDPTRITESDVDTITLEVFSVDEGVTSVPAGAQPIAQLNGTVKGDGRELPAGVTVLYGLSTPSGFLHERQEWPCVGMYFIFPHTGAAKYEIEIEGMNVPHNHPVSTNHDLAVMGTHYEYGFTAGSDLVEPWYDVCKKMGSDGNEGPNWPNSVEVFFDGSKYFLHLFTVVADDYWESFEDKWPQWGEIEGYWIDWMAGSKITVIAK